MFNKSVVPALFWILSIFFIRNGLQVLFLKDLSWLTALTVIFYAIYLGPGFGAVAGAWAGFLLDLYGIGPIGFWVGVLSVTGVCAGISVRKLFRESFFTHLTAAVWGIFLFRFLSAATRGFLEGNGWAWLGSAFSISELLVASVVSVGLFKLLRRISLIPSQSRHASALYP